jgi:hypothetical protein
MQMPIVMPSQVISIIESLFPTVADQHFQQDPLSGVDFKQTNVLKGIVNLIHQIPGELMTISGNQYAQLLISNTIIEEALINIRIGKFNGFSRLNDVNPVAVIYNILKMCPDEFPASGNSDLSFVSDIELRENILRDIGAIERAIRNAEWKAANVLSGAAIEALLLWKLADQVQRGLMARPSSDFEGWFLAPMIDEAEKAGLIRTTTAGAARLCKDFRNLIHPGRALRLRIECNRGTALSAAGALDLMVTDLARSR